MHLDSIIVCSFVYHSEEDLITLSHDLFLKTVLGGETFTGYEEFHLTVHKTLKIKKGQNGLKKAGYRISILHCGISVRLSVLCSKNFSLCVVYASV